MVEVIWGVTLLGGAWRLAGGEHRIVRRQGGAGQAPNTEHRAANAAVLPPAAWTNRESSLIGAQEEQSTVKRCLFPPSSAHGPIRVHSCLSVVEDFLCDY
jgi:hypothetical protein